MIETSRTRGADPSRDHVVDAVWVGLAAAGGTLLVVLNGLLDPTTPGPPRLVDLTLGLAASALLWLRRRHPVAVALTSLPAVALSVAAGPATAVALFAVAARRPLAAAALVAAAQVVAAFVRIVTDATPWEIAVQAVLIVVMFSAGIVAWGQLTRARKQLLTSLRDRAERAEAEQHLRTEHARQSERARIAREMHDVLAHRITLLALHAGALEVRRDLPPDSVETVAVIRVTARLALEELREVVGVLRESGTEGPAPQAPQPGLGTIERLVTECRDAGARIALSIDVEQIDAAPSALGRDAYRIVQEALTNVGKHAPGTPTEVRLSGGPWPRAPRRRPQPPAAGAGTRGAARRGGRAGRARRACCARRGDAGARAGRGGRLRGRRPPGVGLVTPVRVLLVDDDALVRAALRAILSSAPAIEVVGEADDGAGAPAAAAACRPDVVLMDVRMPDVDGITATRLLRAHPGAPQVIVMTTFHLDEYVFTALRAGASGFLLKDTPPDDIIAAVRVVAAGEAMLSPAITRTLIAHYADGSSGARRSAATAGLQGLTGREGEVAAEVGLGFSNAAIAARLHMSEATVKAHVSRLLAKLGVDNRVQVALLVRDADSG